MFKKLLCVCLIGIMVIGLMGCGTTVTKTTKLGNKTNRTTVITYDGDTKEIVNYEESVNIKED